jgi:DNA-binding response OmpR family regulator
LSGPGRGPDPAGFGGVAAILRYSNAADMKLLLVEDSDHLQRSLSACLRRAGYALDVTGDGQEGLCLAEANDYDAILLDIRLPGLDGLSLLRRLREQGQQSHVLLLTGMDAVENRVRGLQEGADDYLGEPFAFDELLARVQALCRRRSGRAQTRKKLER